MLTKLPRDFSDFLRLLNEHRVSYLVIGGYAVAHHGYPRPTADFDIWIAISPANSQRTLDAIRDFGFDDPSLTIEILQTKGQLIRMGLPPMRLEVMNAIDGVEFEACYERRVVADVDGVPVNIISLPDLKANKAATGRNKDKADLDYLP